MSNTTAQGAITALNGTVPTDGSSFIVSARDFTMNIEGTFVGTITIQQKNPFSGLWVDIDSFTGPAARNGFSAHRGAEYRAIASAYTSGTANVFFGAANDA